MLCVCVCAFAEIFMCRKCRIYEPSTCSKYLLPREIQTETCTAIGSRDWYFHLHECLICILYSIHAHTVKLHNRPMDPMTHVQTNQSWNVVLDLYIAYVACRYIPWQLRYPLKKKRFWKTMFLFEVVPFLRWHVTLRAGYIDRLYIYI